MGRVSRIMKAASGRITPPAPIGMEHEVDRSDEDLPRVMACWQHMPEHFKQTVMSLVEIVEARRADAPRKG